MSRPLKIVRRGYQAKRKPTAQELAAWETNTGLKLPDDYRRFLLAWNGGTVSPFVFSHRHLEAAPHEQQRILEVLSDWDDVLDDSRLDDDPTIRAVPPQHLVIGTDPRDVCILLSLAPDTYGRIRTWYKNYDQAWGEPGNDQVGEVAESFSAFLDSLTDGGLDAYHSFWSRPETAPQNPDDLRF
jgi:hypothetical protein